ncbi:MAG TPA: dirigent protein [Nocardioides sp.]|jgi:hypothetical protein|nr:dirigent protein [uncultured Nocardioides sp.]HEX5986771.1 dirigent protein [Nocardioides sp.]
MRSKIVIGGTLATVVAGTLLTVTAADADRAANRVTVVERAVSDSVVDLAPEGDSAGDLLTFANPVYDRSNSRKVGRDQGSCIRTVVGKAWQCSWTTWLPKGSLVVEGPFYDTRGSTMAITGGTGAYARARGVMHLKAANDQGTAFRFSFVLR